ncbi:DUF2225 domain-containing protein [[Clostridium] polysaccharolyticum]|uniref:DUF2225 domain-containing protein n=1 Tax=[Clostridium] polysaccharolyticum TaxID=29364 RepID=A0A1I0D2V3_9FIRM|nr:DUF2225 domain-containing protein [[Clostridium] polysaccharolyticum]SET26501.1 hypothetical protein SAMN04487772_11295 [[Clostridium] polysaccharolyticum]
MSDLFSGLEEFGLGGLKNVEVYENESAKSEEAAPVKHQVTEAEILFDKTYTCPVCDKEFKSKTVRTGKIKLISADTDLRPKYQLVDSLKYDAIVCPHCGYAALSRYFNYMTSTQARFIKEQISNNFKGINQEGDIYTYDEAISRHKLALLSTIVKKSKQSEKAYTCLKLAWLCRGKRESLPEDTENLEEVKKKLMAEELEFLTKAYEGFLGAFSKEMFPMCGMDEHTTTYLVADLARRCGKFDESKRWLSKVLTARDAKERIKAKAREIKELMP